jgi:hypothetical protein
MLVQDTRGWLLVVLVSERVGHRVDDRMTSVEGPRPHSSWSDRLSSDAASPSDGRRLSGQIFHAIQLGLVFFVSITSHVLRLPRTSIPIPYDERLTGAKRQYKSDMV